DGLVRLWITVDGGGLGRFAELAGNTCHVYNVAFHPRQASLLASADLKGVVKQWELTKNAVTRELDASVLHKYDPVFCADHGGALWFWKPDAAQAVHTLALPNNARDLDLHPDGKRLAVPFFDGAVRVYDLAPKAAG